MGSSIESYERVPIRGRAIRATVVMVLLALLASACRVSGDAVSQAERPVGPNDVAETPATGGTGGTDVQATPQAPTAPPTDLPRALTTTDVQCDVPGRDGAKTGLTDQGEAMFADYLDDGTIVPSYELVVDINPVTGQVAGAMRAEVPAQPGVMHFRVFAGMDAFDSGLSITNVTQNGVAVEADLDRALLTIPADARPGRTTTIELDFRFAVDQMAANENLFGALTGESLQPDQVGLLGRTETGMQLGHWFPVWLPPGIRTDPDPSGFGDIGAFPAANICATITVPPGYQTITGGTLVDTTDTSVVEAGAGLRDFAILVSNDMILSAAVVNGVEVRAWGPDGDEEAVLTVLDYAEQSQRALTAAFGPYPWREIDLVAAPLGGGVGGMEWPGMIWIEQSMFAGGLPGMGQFGDLLDDPTLESMLGSVGGPALATSLEWTIAHELGHEWWHATVGNDSIASPAVDEPLAQFSACIAMIDIHPDNWRDICEAQTIDQYAQARALGIGDTAAEQASDAFESSIQYGAIVYGKAPGFYLEAADLIGWNELVTALKTFVADNAFSLVSTDALRSHLITAAGDDGEAIGQLWDRWFRSARGDEDIEPSDLLDAFGGIEGLDGLDDLNLDEMLEGLDLENLDLDDLLQDLDLDELLGEDSTLFSELLEDLLEAEAGTN